MYHYHMNLREKLEYVISEYTVLFIAYRPHCDTVALIQKKYSRERQLYVALVVPRVKATGVS